MNYSTLLRQKGTYDWNSFEMEVGKIRGTMMERPVKGEVTRDVVGWLKFEPAKSSSPKWHLSCPRLHCGCYSPRSRPCRHHGHHITRLRHRHCPRLCRHHGRHSPRPRRPHRQYIMTLYRCRRCYSRCWSQVQTWDMWCVV